MARPSDPLARVKLLAAAEAEFVEHGLDGAKVSDITRRAGISKGAFYLHFLSKTQLFKEMVEAFLARLSTLTDRAMDECDANPATDLPSFLDRWVKVDVEIFEFLYQNRGLLHLLLEGGSGAQFRYLVDDFMERAMQKSRQFLEAGVRDGLYRADLDVDLAATFMAGAYDRLARSVLRETSRPDLRLKLENLQQIILQGIATPELAAKLSETSAPISQSSAISPAGRTGT